MNALLIDFGSTYTKLRAVALDTARILACGQGPSTVATDVCEGLNAALADFESRMGALPDFEGIGRIPPFLLGRSTHVTEDQATAA